jgi:hypothetical protein
LIDQPGPRRDESLACPVQHLQIMLRLALERPMCSPANFRLSHDDPETSCLAG